MKIPVLDPAMYKDAPMKSGKGDAEKAAVGFEAYFIQNMLKDLQTFTGASEKGFMEQTYYAIFNEKIADFLANKGIGIKELIMRYTEKNSTKVYDTGADNMDNP